MVPVPGLAHVLQQEPQLALPPLPPSLLVPPSLPPSTPLDRRQIATCIGNLVALALNLIGALEKLFYEFDVKHPLAPTNGQLRDSPDDHDEEERLRSAAVLARVELLQNGLITVDEHIRQLLRDLTFVDDDLHRKIELVRERAAIAR